MAAAPTVVAQWDPRRIDPNAQLGPKPGVVRLSSNENPYGPGPKALKAASKDADSDVRKGAVTAVKKKMKRKTNSRWKAAIF